MMSSLTIFYYLRLWTKRCHLWVDVLYFQESYRNDAQLAKTSARNTVFGLGITLGCILLYAVIMTIVAGRDCIRQRWQRNVRSKSDTRQLNDTSITGRPIWVYFVHYNTSVTGCQWKCLRHLYVRHMCNGRAGFSWWGAWGPAYLGSLSGRL